MDRQYSNTPWTYYDYIFRLPILDNQTTVNFERYSNPRAWNLVKQLNQTPTTNQGALKRLNSQIQRIFLRDLPAIPLWYNGLWAQWNTTNWSNFPGSGSYSALPAMWRNYLQMTSIEMLTKIRPKAAS